MEAQLSAHHVGQLDVHFIIADGPPGVVVQHLHAPFVRLARIVARQTHLCCWRASRPALRGRGPPRFSACGTAEGHEEEEEEEAEAEGAGHRGREEGACR